jgi:hypothetical protein
MFSSKSSRYFCNKILWMMLIFALFDVTLIITFFIVQKLIELNFLRLFWSLMFSARFNRDITDSIARCREKKKRRKNILNFNNFSASISFKTSLNEIFDRFIIIIKIILDLTSSLRRFMRKNYWRLQKKILNENKNLFLYARSRFDFALTELLRRIIAWRSFHHHFLSLCLLNIWNRTARQVIWSASSSTKIVLINSFSWINWSSLWFFWRWSKVV